MRVLPLRLVLQLLLVAALVPPEGGNGLDCMKPAHAEGLAATVEAARAHGGPPVTLPDSSRVATTAERRCSTPAGVSRRSHWTNQSCAVAVSTISRPSEYRKTIPLRPGLGPKPLPAPKRWNP